jgi:hypothetical protein
MSARPSLPMLQQAAKTSEFRQMHEAFRASGGIVGCEEVVASLSRFTCQPISRLARWIVDGDILPLQWQGIMMLPLFQFDRTWIAPDPCVAPVIRELLPVLQEWDACLWFAQPNPWLAHALPVEMVRRDPAAVLQAARAARPIAIA